MQDFEVNLFNKMEIDTPVAKAKLGGYVVPDAYFENFEKGIFAKIDSEKQKTKFIPLFSRRKIYYAAAVAAIFITIISSVLLKSPTTGTLNNVEYAALEDYLNDEVELDLNYNELSNLLYEDGVIIESLNASTFSDEAIIEYLNENVEDTRLIIE